MLEYDGLEIEAGEGLYEPAEDSFLLAEMVKEELGGRKGLRVLDMGTGTGIIGLTCAASANVKEVLMADVNPDAVALAKSNYEKNRKAMAARCRFAISDLFGNVEGKFDIMIFNAPYLRHEESRGRNEWWDGGKEGIEVSLRFLEGAMEHIADGGRVFLVYSRLSNHAKLEREMARLGFRIARSRSAHFFFEDIVAVSLEAGAGR